MGILASYWSLKSSTTPKDDGAFQAGLKEKSSLNLEKIYLCCYCMNWCAKLPAPDCVVLGTAQITIKSALHILH